VAAPSSSRGVYSQEKMGILEKKEEKSGNANSSPN
jgi:hypothetical protein